jgi:hypothetical protein
VVDDADAGVRSSSTHGVHNRRDAAFGRLRFGLFLLLCLWLCRSLFLRRMACDCRNDEEENRYSKPAAEQHQFAFAQPLRGICACSRCEA